MNLTANRLRDLLSYNPETGEFVWRVTVSSRAMAGFVAGCVYAQKLTRYRGIRVDGRLYKAHRLAWLYVHGVWPAEQLDHIDGDGANNRIANLRQATNSENNRNRKVRYDSASGCKGVNFHKGNRKWRAHIRLNGRQKHLGYFSSAEEAYAAYCLAAPEIHGQFARI
jgi:hypothetical protein